MNTRLCIVFSIGLGGFVLSAQQNPGELTSSVTADSTFRWHDSDKPTDQPWSSSRCLIALDIDSDTIGSPSSPSFVEAVTSSYGARFSTHRERFAYLQIERVATVLPIDLAPKQGPPTTHTNC